ncbi:MAG: uroporphyrinogen-III synthase [Bacteroidetes bacterium]|nr:uroporphyrinogen-III synthase [Bacteroidota bacterium]
MNSDRVKKVKSILITQPAPEPGKNIYEEFAKKHKLKIDFRAFIHIDPLAPRDIRKQKVNFLDFTAIIFNSKNAVDNFFNIASEMKVEMPADTKYFSINESVSNYVQKYIVPRKRKMFNGKGTEKDFLALCKNHPKEKFLFPCSDIRKSTIPDFFNKNKLNFTECIIYRTVSSDLSDLKDVFYDILVFFSPADIKSLYDNFPDFIQNDTRLAGFGTSTQQAIDEHKLILDIPAPTVDSPSMLNALERYVARANSEKKS